MGLEWEPPFRTASERVFIMYSRCRRFSIHAEKERDPQMPSSSVWRYTAFIRTPYWNNLLGRVGTKDEAIALCEERASREPIREKP